MSRFGLGLIDVPRLQVLSGRYRRPATRALALRSCLDMSCNPYFGQVTTRNASRKSTGKQTLLDKYSTRDAYVRCLGFPKGSVVLCFGASGADGARKPFEGSGGRGEERGQFSVAVL